ncbi:MAG: carbohydrate ABC transporter permease [Chloroflexi bacterium]|nr:carbohydrate ABC transporter permease [Chloroflexota bacterium]
MTARTRRRRDDQPPPLFRLLREQISFRRWYIHILLWIAVIFMGFPLFYAALVSTQNNAQMFRLQMIPGDSFSFNLQTVLDRNIARLMFNTFAVATMVTLGKVVLSIFSGMALVYFRFPAKSLVFGFILAALMVPGEVTIIALFRLVALELGWGNTWTALVVPAVASPTGVFLFRQHFASITPELSEAAQLDGAGPLQFLLRVLVPLSRNTITALVVIMFIGGWNSYLWPLLIVTNPDLQVIQVGLSTLDDGVEIGRTWGPIMLGAVIASIPPIFIFVLMQKQFLQGFALTRSK